MDAVHALVYGDLFMRCLYHVRPYELEKGSAEAIHQKWKEICVDSLVNPQNEVALCRRLPRHRGGL